MRRTKSKKKLNFGTDWVAERLGAHMFEKLPSGYRLTVAGEEVLEFADQMEASSH